MTDGIRLARPEDSDRLLEIYAPYIRDTAITFELDVPSPAEYRQRVAGIAAFYPYLVWTENSGIAGYAYASKYHERLGYGYDVSTSVYLRPEIHGRGIGRRLYSCLLELVKAQGVQIAYAGITLPNEKSMGMHTALGFSTVGVFRRTGRKFGKWLDVAWLEKALGDFPENPMPLAGVKELPTDYSGWVMAKWSA